LSMYMDEYFLFPSSHIHPPQSEVLHRIMRLWSGVGWLYG
jgi:hypothetical protein